MRPRKRAGGLLLGAVVLFVIGTNIEAGWLFVLASLLGGSVVVGSVLAAGSLRGLEARLDAPAEAPQGSQVPVTVHVTNRSRGVRWAAIAVDAHLDGARSFLGTIRPGDRVTATTLRPAQRRGLARTTVLELRSSVPLGIVERRRRVAVDASTLVLPRVVPTGPLWFVEPAMSSEPAGDVEHRRGNGPDYVAVREYRSGDPMRHVHWGLTARHGQLMVREFEQERTPRVAIWVDTSAAGDALDRCCTVAASILDAATTTGTGVRLLATSARGELSLASRRPRADLMRWLALLEPSGVDAAAGLEQLVDGSVAGIGTLVVTLAEEPRPAVVATLVALLPSVERLVVVGVGSTGPGAALRASGITVLTWGIDQELAASLAGPGRLTRVPG